MEQAGMELIKGYFPDISSEQTARFQALGSLFGEWNERINVISRKDIDQLYLRHVLHSLAIAKVCRFDDGARVLDLGTGGGFPGIPLAILFPNTRFTLCDSVGKKITVVRGVAQSLGLDNVVAINARAESVNQKFDYVVSRAVTDMSSFLDWVWDKIERAKRGTLSNGVLCLKGGELEQEMALTGRKYVQYDIGSFFTEDFFETKKVIYIKK